MTPEAKELAKTEYLPSIDAGGHANGPQDGSFLGENGGMPRYPLHAVSDDDHLDGPRAVAQDLC